MSMIIDLIVVAFILLCIILGYRKGLTGSLLKIVSFVLALVVAFILFKPISGFIIDNTNWDENLEQTIRNMVQNSEEENSENKDNLQEKNDSKTNEQETENTQNMPTVIVDYINQAVENAGTEAKGAILDATARNIAVTIINVGVLITLFILSRIVLFFIKGLADLITKLPVIKQFDKLGGIIYGMLEALVVLYVIFAIISFISPFINGTEFIGSIQKSFFGNLMYNNNLLLKLLF